MKCASTYDEIKPLNELCKAGKLFEVQKWIAAGKPVNLSPPKKGSRAKNPLEISIERGFHSLVQVLLEGGASIDDPRYSPLSPAISEKRLDLVKLPIRHGADINPLTWSRFFKAGNRNCWIGLSTMTQMLKPAARWHGRSAIIFVPPLACSSDTKNDFPAFRSRPT
jgi:hypothetical protein